MLNDHQLSTATVRLKHMTKRLRAHAGPIEREVFLSHLRVVRTLEKRLGGTRKHLGNMANARGRGPVPVARGQIGASRARIAQLEKALAKYLLAVVAHAPSDLAATTLAHHGELSVAKSNHEEVMLYKGVINVVKGTKKMFDQAQFTATVRQEFDAGHAIITQGHPHQSLDTVTGLLMMVAACLEMLRMYGFLRRAS